MSGAGLVIAALLALAPQEPGPPPGALAAFREELEAVLAGGDAAALRAMGTEEFQEAVSAAELNAGFRQILAATAGPPLPLEIDPGGWRREPFQHVLVGRGRTREAVFRVSFDAEGRIAGMRSRLGAAPSPVGVLLQRALEWPGRVGFAAARADSDGRIRGRLVLHRGGRAYPLGSLFKVYVLAELARREALGEIHPEQRVELREEWKSLPSGTLQAEEAGSRWSVADLTRRMIRDSDNTATDHLLMLVGRTAVEQLLPAAHNSVPGRNRPFLTTWEMFRLKALPEAAAEFGGDLDALARAWGEGDPDKRRQLLARALGGLDPEREPAAWRQQALLGYSLRTLGAREHERIEWFAAPEDITALFLDASSGRFLDPETSRLLRSGLGHGTRLYEGPGIVFQGFKGGNETGVLTLAVLVELEDGGSAAVCVCRAAFPPLAPQVLEETSEFTTSLLRAAIERRLPLQAEGAVLEPR